ncbi:MAG: leucine-rich repeat protein [Clostridia bacterium]|nr:leucine-rich repeat protein [Clostridia bacterium]
MKKFLSLVLLLIITLFCSSCTTNTPYIGENGNWWINNEDSGISAQGEIGAEGPIGPSISVSSIKKTDTSGAIDTYTIYFSDGSSSSFTVTNGTDGKTITIYSVDKINTNGLIDTYKITFSDNSSHTFTVKNGENGKSVTIASIGKSHSVGLVDTYEIVFSDGSSSSFSVTNGRDGNTPYIGTNGNWWVGEEDTGIKATTDNMDRIGTDGLIFQMTIRNGIAGYEVSDYIGTETDIIIPNYIFDKPVISILADALPTKTTSISISNNTEFLPDFEDYTNLTKFDFNNAPINSLPNNIFRDCSNLETVENYNNIQVIPNYAFYGTKIINFDFSNVTSIGSYAFYNCNITDYDLTRILPKLFVYIPENVLSIGANAFDSDLAVYYAGSSSTFTSEILYTNIKKTDTGYYYLDDKTSITIVNYDGSDTSIVIPKIIDNKPVVALSDYAFYVNPFIKRVEIPSSVKTIGKNTFYLCKNLYGVFVPESVEDCGEFKNLTTKQSYGFENTTVFFEATTFDYPNGITSPEQLSLDKYVTGIKPNDIIDDEYCVYLKKTLSYEVVTIKNLAGSITIPASIDGLPVSRINTYALYEDTLTKLVHISDGIDKISTQAFYSSSNLVIVNVPNSIDAVNYRGFYSLSNCTVHIKADEIPVDWDSNWYYSIYAHKLNSQAKYTSDGAYLYEFVENNLYLTKYLQPISTNTPIIIPEKINGKTVYGIRSNCFNPSASTSTTNRYIFVIPSSITVMEANAIYTSGYGYSNLYMSFENSSDIPSTWNSLWFYSSYGYSYNNSRNNVYYKNDWKLVDNVPYPKN